MAFDLNKNDGANTGSSKKNNPTSKFDLSKNDVKESGSSSKTWIFILLAMLIIGAGVWYYSSNMNTEESTSVKATHEDSVLKDTPIGVTSTNTPQEQTNVTPTNSVNTNNETIEAIDKKIPVTFAQGSVEIQNPDQELVKNIISYLEKNPEAIIQVNGYASSDGSLEINQTISVERANAFKNYLVSKNISKSRIQASGMGIENPIASNATATGRAKNRRIEINLK